ncbi:hypothetical protein [Paraurantiacibacter namhicola]|uniref:Uncharacterized protein n=1 Tax=Paraurantiacibacter namhicola TaxID=645517 RepID=A0A1C7D9A8_9SPHN|nr:hypothetical protein [Paraurantiacibacter namhicola]ANU07952.1 hypothetical protein A6F65_01654 [Paraurantiacibacter namhicola]
MNARKLTSALTAMAVAIAPQVVAAQECMTEAEVNAMAIYAAPAAMDAAAYACRDALPADSFLLSELGPMKARYDAVRPDYWPLALSAATKLMASEGDGSADDMAIFQQLPEEAVRPMIDALIVQELSTEIKPEDCGSIDKVVAAFGPLEPTEFGGIIGAVLTVAVPDEDLFCSET